jgi:peptidoglycan/xylan/chitin deacetylase (PgdA/CDA1 family)
MLGAAGCSNGSDDQPSPSASASATGFAAPQLAVVEPTVVTGITSTVDENLEKGRYTYLTFPVIPGAEAWATTMKADLAPQLARFNELATASDQPPYPELQVKWELVGASPEAIGVRLVTSELADDKTFQGKAETTWWDPSAGAARPAQSLIDQDKSAEFFTRLRTAAEADPRVDKAKLSAQLDGDWESFNSVAFTTEGLLWIEFDRNQVADTDEPLGVAVDPDGLLSPFGRAARRASMDPSDPALKPAASPTPTPTASPSRTATAKPTPTATAKPASPSARPTRTPTATTGTGGGTVNCAVQACVALTFDDGPVAQTTELLDIFARKGAKATFFVVGSNAANHPEILRRMVAEGHVVANHTMDHAQLTRLSADAVRKELTRANDQIRNATGQTPTLVRPPYGATNATVRSVASGLGMSQIMWNVDPEDWKDKNAATVRSRVLANTGRGDIVLSHAIHPTTRAAYAGIIDGLRAKGYVLVTIPELLGSSLTPGQAYYSR